MKLVLPLASSIRKLRQWVRNDVSSYDRSKMTPNCTNHLHGPSIPKASRRPLHTGFGDGKPKCCQAFQCNWKNGLMNLLLLQSGQVTQWSMINASHAASLVFTTWIDAFITASLCPVPKGGDARSACSLVDMYLLASIRHYVGTASSVRYEDVLHAELRAHKTTKSPHMVPTTKLYDLVPHYIGV